MKEEKPLAVAISKRESEQWIEIQKLQIKSNQKQEIKLGQEQLMSFITISNFHYKWGNGINIKCKYIIFHKLEQLGGELGFLKWKNWK